MVIIEPQLVRFRPRTKALSVPAAIADFVQIGFAADFLASQIVWQAHEFPLSVYPSVVAHLKIDQRARLFVRKGLDR